MSAQAASHPRIYALDQLAQIGPGGSEEDIVEELIQFLNSIGEATVAMSAHRALERLYAQ